VEFLPGLSVNPSVIANLHRSIPRASTTTCMTVNITGIPLPPSSSITPSTCGNSKSSDHASMFLCICWFGNRSARLYPTCDGQALVCVHQGPFLDLGDEFVGSQGCIGTFSNTIERWEVRGMSGVIDHDEYLFVATLGWTTGGGNTWCSVSSTTQPGSLAGPPTTQPRH
jgi:hypothetical protein